MSEQKRYSIDEMAEISDEAWDKMIKEVKSVREEQNKKRIKEKVLGLMDDDRIYDLGGDISPAQLEPILEELIKNL